MVKELFSYFTLDDTTLTMQLAPLNQIDELLEVVTTVGGTINANVEFKISFTSADRTVVNDKFEAPLDISLPYLQDKMLSIFSLPSLDDYEISWIDENRDSITVQSSEDLVHALNAMKDAVIKFNLKTKTAQNPTNMTTLPFVTSSENTSEFSAIHVCIF
jgi:hypothetical protein